MTPEELELFKREFSTSAYTCRLTSCPRATAGFDTNGLRLQHEATHSQRLQCLYPSCRYPPFMSTRALKNHENKCHKMAQGRKRIRRVAAWSQYDPEGSQEVERAQTQVAGVQTPMGPHPSQAQQVQLFQLLLQMTCKYADLFFLFFLFFFNTGLSLLARPSFVLF